jgi:hypothetical protein
VTVDDGLFDAGLNFIGPMTVAPVAVSWITPVTGCMRYFSYVTGFGAKSCKSQKSSRFRCGGVAP